MIKLGKSQLWMHFTVILKFYYTFSYFGKTSLHASQIMSIEKITLKIIILM